MSFAEIEAQLDKLTSDELRLLALRSWSAFVAKEGLEYPNQCDEDNPALLAALDEAVASAESGTHRTRTGQELRELVSEWTSK
ncbi:MAG TPA: hypothetical protein VN937_20890 [Blastocatellia bacterium]|nr:hypothetical protein [Blastocatellia bacterium]